MKYIVLGVQVKDGFKMEVPFVFPEILVHKHVADQLTGLMQQYWPQAEIKPIAAGDLSSMSFDEGCAGKSDTLGLQSREEIDDMLIRMCDYGGMHK